MADNFERGAGVLCHISSLPGEYGIGSLGDEAYDFARLLKRAGVKYWQILPTVHTGYGDSPFQPVSLFAGNPYFIDLKALYRRGLLDEEELSSAAAPSGDIDYAVLYERRFTLLRLAYARFNVKDRDFVAFVESKEFEDYALFMSLKSRYGGTFDTFPDAYKYREKLAMLEFRRSVMKSDFLFWQFVQYEYARQWKKLKAYVNSLGIKIIGSIPLYAAYDSADVWANPALFKLDKSLKPSFIVTDPENRRRENPLYDWDRMAEDGFTWWTKRIERAASQFDIISIDRFNELERYYAVSTETDGAEGEWLSAPGGLLFSEIRRKAGDLNIIAGDCASGDAVAVRLMERTGFASAKRLLNPFGETASNICTDIRENSVVYTGSYDGDTTLGVLNAMPERQFSEFKTHLRAALKSEGVVYPFVTREDAVWAAIYCALASPAQIAVLPVQDILRLGSESRLTDPSKDGGNWRYRMEGLLSRRSLALLRNAIKQSGR